jgi:hypothetical protein
MYSRSLGSAPLRYPYLHLFTLTLVSYVPHEQNLAVSAPFVSHKDGAGGVSYVRTGHVHAERR